MDKNKRGFTLIELLAVIVILAIIALIAVPVIMNVITKARISAFEDSAYGIVKAAELYYSNQLLEPEGMTKNEEFIVENDVFKNIENSDTLDLSGSIPSSGKVTVTSEGKVALVISNGEYCIQKSTSESKVKAVKQANCTDYKKTANPVFTTSTANATIPACIKDNTECDVSAAGDDGIGVAVKVNDSQIYDFYVMSEDTNKGTITLIMNQNLGGAQWISEEDYGCGSEFCIATDKGPITALKEVESQTVNWTNIPLETYTLKDDNTTPAYSDITITARARLLTITEAKELGCTTSEGSCPTWLYEKTDYGSGFSPYWTSSAVVNNYFAWNVAEYGAITSYDYPAYTSLDIRPVITISKSSL